MRIIIITFLAFISTVASAQLSRSFNQDFVARVGLAEDYIDFFVSGKASAIITDNVVISDMPHAIGREDIPVLCQALWNQ